MSLLSRPRSPGGLRETRLWACRHSGRPARRGTTGQPRNSGKPDAGRDLSFPVRLGRLRECSLPGGAGDDPPLFWVLLDENVLHREIGGAKVMRDQLTHLAGMARRPNVTVQVIPCAGAHVGLQGGFVMTETAESQVAYVDHIADGMTTDSPAIVTQVSMRFDTLRTDAYRGAESLMMIEEMAEKWAP